MSALPPVRPNSSARLAPESDVDDLERVLSERARNLPGSPVRELLSMHREKDTLDLGGGIPDIALFPSEKLVEVTARVVRDNAAQALQYAPTEGLLPLREFVASRLNQRGCQVNANQVIMTHGSQQALATAASLLTGPGQPVLLEQPGYPGAIQAFSLAQAPILPLPVTAEGWNLDAVRKRKAAAMYVIPNFQNPTGRQASRSDCADLLRYRRESDAFLIEDDAYGELGFEQEPTRPLLADATTRGVLLGTFSKTLCPGMRVGWLVLPRDLVGPAVRVLQATSLQPGTLSQHLAWELIRELDWQAHVDQLRNSYRARAQALRARCEQLGFASEMPRGGLFVWLRSPGPAAPFARRAAAEGVFSVPESGFRHALHPGADDHVRLACSRYFDTPAQADKLTQAFSVARAQNRS